MISALIGVLIIVVIGAICFWAIDRFANDRRLAQLLKLLVVLICLGAILQGCCHWRASISPREIGSICGRALGGPSSRAARIDRRHLTQQPYEHIRVNPRTLGH